MELQNALMHLLLWHNIEDQETVLEKLRPLVQSAFSSEEILKRARLWTFSKVRLVRTDSEVVGSHLNEVVDP